MAIDHGLRVRAGVSLNGRQGRRRCKPLAVHRERAVAHVVRHAAGRPFVRHALQVGVLVVADAVLVLADAVRATGVATNRLNVVGASGAGD